MARSRLAPIFLLAVFVFPLFAHAALININTADAATLDSLPGIGPTKAQAIVDYRNANGSFATIADIQKVSGIGPSTFANIESFITVGDTTASQEPAATSAAATTTVAIVSVYTPPPSALSVAISGSANALLNVPEEFSAHAQMKSGGADAAAQIVWSFGDGSMQTGTLVSKTYRYPGTYAVVVTATDGDASARAELDVTVAAPSVSVTSVTADGITLRNDADALLDLSLWRLDTGAGVYVLPEGVTLLPHASVLFPSSVTNLPVAFDARLVAPDGIVQAQFSPAPPTTFSEKVVGGAGTSLEPATPAPAQPLAPAAGSYSLQTVESAVTGAPAGNNAVEAAVAPAAPEAPAAAGAPTSSPLMAGPAAAPGVAKLMHSPYAYGFLGILVLAGSAFLIL